MALEQYQTYLLQPLIAILAVITVFYTYKVLSKIDYNTLNVLKKAAHRVFFFLAIGMLLFASAEIIFGMLSLLGYMTDVSIADIFWTVGYFFLVAGYGLFAYTMHKLHGYKTKSKVVLGLVTVVSAAVVYYLILNYIVPAESFAETFISYFYPIASTVVFILAITVFFFLKHLDKMGKALFYLASFSVFDFIGNVLYTYVIGQNIYGLIGILSDSSFVLSYVAMIMGLSLLLKSEIESFGD